MYTDWQDTSVNNVTLRNVNDARKCQPENKPPTVQVQLGTGLALSPGMTDMTSWAVKLTLTHTYSPRLCHVRRKGRSGSLSHKHAHSDRFWQDWTFTDIEIADDLRSHLLTFSLRTNFLFSTSTSICLEKWLACHGLCLTLKHCINVNCLGVTPAVN